MEIENINEILIKIGSPISKNSKSFISSPLDEETLSNESHYYKLNDTGHKKTYSNSNNSNNGSFNNGLTVYNNSFLSFDSHDDIFYHPSNIDFLFRNPSKTENYNNDSDNNYFDSYTSSIDNFDYSRPSQTKLFFCDENNHVI